jgi:hypothetical protein
MWLGVEIIKNDHQNNVSYKGIELHAKGILTIIDLVVNIIRGASMPIVNEENKLSL